MKLKFRQLEKLLTDVLEDQSFEDFLEVFDLTPVDVFVLLYDEGMLDDQLLERYLAVD